MTTYEIMLPGTPHFARIELERLPQQSVELGGKVGAVARLLLPAAERYLHPDLRVSPAGLRRGDQLLCAGERLDCDWGVLRKHEPARAREHEEYACRYSTAERRAVAWARRELSILLRALRRRQRLLARAALRAELATIGPVLSVEDHLREMARGREVQEETEAEESAIAAIPETQRAQDEATELLALGHTPPPPRTIDTQIEDAAEQLAAMAT